MSRWDSSTGTLLFWPDRACLREAKGLLSLLPPARIRVSDDDWHNPIAWLDPHSRGAFLRLMPLTPFSDADELGWGPIDWDNAGQAEAVLAVAEGLAAAHTQPLVRSVRLRRLERRVPRPARCHLLPGLPSAPDPGRAARRPQRPAPQRQHSHPPRRWPRVQGARPRLGPRADLASTNGPK